MAKKKSLPIAKSSPSVAEAPKLTANDKARERRWKAEDALRDIQRAEEHKKNKQLMDDVKLLAKEQVNNLKKFC